MLAALAKRRVALPAVGVDRVLSPDGSCDSSAFYREGGSALGFCPPRGFVPPAPGGEVSGLMAILGSTLGGGTAERGCGTVLGRRSIPGSMFEGGTEGTPPDGFSGVV